MPLRIRPRRRGMVSQWLIRTRRWCLRTTSTPVSDSGAPVATCSLSSCAECGTRVLHLLLRGHAIRRRGREMCAAILDQPFIAVTGGHVENVDWYHGNNRSIRTFDIAHGEECVGDRDIGFDETDAIVGERRLRGGSNSLFRFRSEVLHHGGVSLQEVADRRHKGSIFGEQGRPLFGILLNESLSEAISERANGC